MNEEANLISKFPAAFHEVDAMGFPKRRSVIALSLVARAV